MTAYEWVCESQILNLRDRLTAQHAQRTRRDARLALAIWIGLVLLVASVLPGLAHAQESAKAQPQFLVYADTANITPVAPQTYLTWVYARSSPNAHPASAIQVAWNCATHEVRRYYHIKYMLRADSLGVVGGVVKDDTGWVPMTDQRLFDLVCRIGPTHGDWTQSYPKAQAPDTGRVPSPNEHTS